MRASIIFSLGIFFAVEMGLAVEQDPSLLVVPADGTLVRFSMEGVGQQSETPLIQQMPRRHEVGYFFVDAPDGRILRRTGSRLDAPPLLDSRDRPQFFRPTDPDYAELALRDARATTLFPWGLSSQANVEERKVMLPGDRFVGFFLIEDHSIESWRYAPAGERPQVWFSFPAANPDRFVALQELDRNDTRPGWNCFEWKIDRGIRFSYHLLPIATDDAFTVYCTGDDFRGQPMPLQIDTPLDTVNQGFGLFFNDRAFDGCSLTVTHIRRENSGEEWIELKQTNSELARATIEDPETHGQVTVHANGGVQFLPKQDDPYWHIESQPLEPIPVNIEYRVSDGIDSVDCRFGIGHGHYHRGKPADNKHEGSRMYFLAGGGRGVPFDAGRVQFFSQASSNRDIVLISQALENKDFANRVFEYFAANQARSVTCLSITSRSQADDPRMAKVIGGADVIWFGGGSQSFFLESWKGTKVYDAISHACTEGVAIGGTSAGSAILGQAAYADLPWDSVQSCFALRDPDHDRLRTMHQGEDGFPFESLSSHPAAPLHGMIVETHFVDSNRMGRLAVFASKCQARPMSGLGLAASTAVLIQPQADDWKWTVFGSGSAFVINPGAAYCIDDGSDGRDFHCDRVHVVRLKSGEQSLLSAISNARPSYRVFIREGVVYSLDNMGRLY